jgi:hypothetical protein
VTSRGRFVVPFAWALSFALGAEGGLGAARAAAGDSLAVHVETGVGVDVTNEQFYEDAFVDTTFLGRQLLNTPETRVAGLLSVFIAGTRAERTTGYELRNELNIGDKLQRSLLELDWRQDFDPTWRWSLDPRFEYRHDQTFGRDLEETHASLGSRIRHDLGSETLAELGAAAEVLRSSGEGDEFVLDRNAARGFVSLDHLGMKGADWRLAYRLDGRVFPDSSERDHFEHGWEARIGHTFSGGHTFGLETVGLRRQTIRIVPTSRDNFWDVSGAAEGDVRISGATELRMRVEGEAFRYDVEDSVLFFDYQLGRARLDVRRAFERGLAFAVGPRVERLTSKLDPGEAYWETGAALELEFLGRSSWWNLTPAAGWREYDALPDAVAGEFPGEHSSYAFYELGAFVDQALLSALRLRGLATARTEFHTDPAQNATSVYVSFQLVWSAR